LLTPGLARLAAIGGFRRLAPKVQQYFRDPRLQRIFSFQSMYAGVSPHQALALFGVIAYLDTIAGVFFT
jgi:phytoene desaturase